MYADFELNSVGDLIFNDNVEKSIPQKISFNLSHTATQKIAINFYESQEVKHTTNNYLKVEFFIDNNKPKNSTNILYGQDAKAQLIMLKLKTTLGELPNRKDFGSKLSVFKHEVLDDASMKLLANYIKSVLDKDILNISVNVRPIIDYKNGYKQTVVVDIYSGSDLILDYKIER